MYIWPHQPSVQHTSLFCKIVKLTQHSIGPLYFTAARFLFLLYFNFYSNQTTHITAPYALSAHMTTMDKKSSIYSPTEKQLPKMIPYLPIAFNRITPLIDYNKKIVFFKHFYFRVLSRWLSHHIQLKREKNLIFFFVLGWQFWNENIKYKSLEKSKNERSISIKQIRRKLKISAWSLLSFFGLCVAFFSQSLFSAFFFVWMGFLNCKLLNSNVAQFSTIV